MPFGKWWFLAFMAVVPALCLASVDDAPARIAGGPARLASREYHLWNSAIHDSKFATLVPTANRTTCGATEPPQALATPDPLLEETDLHSKISVSFIIGTDGHVHSALILDERGADRRPYNSGCSAILALSPCPVQRSSSRRRGESGVFQSLGTIPPPQLSAAC